MEFERLSELDLPSLGTLISSIHTCLTLSGTIGSGIGSVGFDLSRMLHLAISMDAASRTLTRTMTAMARVQDACWNLEPFFPHPNSGSDTQVQARTLRDHLLESPVWDQLAANIGLLELNQDLLAKESERLEWMLREAITNLRASGLTTHPFTILFDPAQLQGALFTPDEDHDRLIIYASSPSWKPPRISTFYNESLLWCYYVSALRSGMSDEALAKLRIIFYFQSTRRLPPNFMDCDLAIRARLLDNCTSTVVLAAGHAMEPKPASVMAAEEVWQKRTKQAQNYSSPSWKIPTPIQLVEELRASSWKPKCGDMWWMRGGRLQEPPTHTHTVHVSQSTAATLLTSPTPTRLSHFMQLIEGKELQPNPTGRHFAEDEIPSHWHCPWCYMGGPTKKGVWFWACLAHPSHDQVFLCANCGSFSNYEAVKQAAAELEQQRQRVLNPAHAAFIPQVASIRHDFRELPTPIGPLLQPSSNHPVVETSKSKVPHCQDATEDQQLQVSGRTKPTATFLEPFRFRRLVETMYRAMPHVSALMPLDQLWSRLQSLGAITALDTLHDSVRLLSLLSVAQKCHGDMLRVDGHKVVNELYFQIASDHDHHHELVVEYDLLVRWRFANANPKKTPVRAWGNINELLQVGTHESVSRTSVSELQAGNGTVLSVLRDVEATLLRSKWLGQDVRSTADFQALLDNTQIDRAIVFAYCSPDDDGYNMSTLLRQGFPALMRVVDEWERRIARRRWCSLHIAIGILTSLPISTGPTVGRQSWMSMGSTCSVGVGMAW